MISFAPYEILSGLSDHFTATLDGELTRESSTRERSTQKLTWPVWLLCDDRIGIFYKCFGLYIGFSHNLDAYSSKRCQSLRFISTSIAPKRPDTLRTHYFCHHYRAALLVIYLAQSLNQIVVKLTKKSGWPRADLGYGPLTYFLEQFGPITKYH